MKHMKHIQTTISAGWIDYKICRDSVELHLEDSYLTLDDAEERLDEIFNSKDYIKKCKYSIVRHSSSNMIFSYSK